MEKVIVKLDSWGHLTIEGGISELEKGDMILGVYDNAERAQQFVQYLWDQNIKTMYGREVRWPTPEFRQPEWWVKLKKHEPA